MTAPSRLRWHRTFVDWVVAKHSAVHWLEDLGQWVLPSLINIESDVGSLAVPLIYEPLPSDLPFLYRELEAWLDEEEALQHELEFSHASTYHVTVAKNELLSREGVICKITDFKPPTLVFLDGYWVEGHFTPWQEIIEDDAYVKSFFHFPFKYCDLEEGATPLWDNLRARYPTQIFWVEQFFLRLILGYDKDEYMLHLVGPGSSGKGTAEGVFRSNLDGWIAGISLNAIGTRFGLQGVLGKRGIADTDMSMAPLYDNTISIVKKLTGRDGIMQTDIKGRPQVDIDGIFFLYTCANLFPKLKNVSLTGWFRRQMILEFNKPFEVRDPTVKNEIVKEFPYILWELLQMGIKPLPEKFYEKQVWALEQQKLWQKWSDPVCIACINLFEAQTEGEVPYDMAADRVAEELRRLTFMVPHETALKRQITTILRQQFQAELEGRSEDKKYVGCTLKAWLVEITPTSQTLRDEILAAVGNGIFPEDLLAGYELEQQTEVAEILEVMQLQGQLREEYGLLRTNKEDKQ